MLKQTFQQKLLQKLSPQQIQLMKLLQVPTAELEQRIKEELEINPALDEGREETEEYADEAPDDYEDDSRTESEKEIDINDYLSDDDDTPDYKLSITNKGRDDDDKAVPIAQGTSFHELLVGQLSWRMLSDRERILAETLIGNLDDNGYLRRELDAIVDDLAFTQNLMTSVDELEDTLKDTVQDLDPPGVGARNLQECLLIQIYRNEKGTDYSDISIDILEQYFDAFSKKHYQKIMEGLDISEESLKGALDEIIHLNPKPGNSSSDSARTMQTIIPDFIIDTSDGEISLSLNGRNAPELRISKDYKEMLQTYSETKSNKDAVQFVKQKIDSAKWFIDAIKQRQETLLYTMTAIVEYQREFFLTGDETNLKPMILKDIAEKVGLDISTISRVANSKYAQTDHGTYLLKSFFSESLTKDDGEEVSTIEVKKILQESVEAEDKTKPLTDEKLMALLKEKGYQLARRTVAKYREQLNIPVARLRKEL